MIITAEKLIEELQKHPKDTKVCVLDKEGEPDGVEGLQILNSEETLYKEKVVLLTNYR